MLSGNIHDSKRSINNQRNSFTLIELLVVLALVAILSVVVVMTLNPAELIKQARDSNRLSDLATINTALNLFNADVTAGFMGTSTVVYVSIPDNASSICGSLGLPTLPSGYSYNCVTTANLRNTDGTGWIPVNFHRISSNSPISQLPVDPINATTTLNYYTYMSGGSWKLSAISLESQKYIAKGNEDGGIASASFEMGNNMSLGQGIFPAGWIKVPGNSTFGTSDFWVMKYEAKCASSTIPGIGLTSPANGTVYVNSTTACTGSRTVVSLPDGYPITKISQVTSMAYCQQIGAHLITNNEWQTIAWNAESVASNWNGGVVGTSYIYSGHNDGVPAGALTATADDNDGYYGTGQTTGYQRRTLTLSNGQVIWDLSANLYEWTSDTISGTNQPYSGVASWQYREFPTITNWGTLSQQAVGPSNSSWVKANGVGSLYSWDGSADATTYAFLRGGVWYIGTNSGIEALHLAVAPTSDHFYYTFRCVK